MDGAFTNGPVWWETLADDFGVDAPVPFYAGVASGTFPTSVPNEGLNFAVGGAATGTDNTGNAQSPPFPVDLPGLADQVEAYSSLIGPSGADPDALYVLWIGGNNFLGAYVPIDPANPYAPFQDFTTDPSQPVGDISIAIQTLYDLGARKFLVGNLYDFGATPLAAELEMLSQAEAIAPATAAMK